MSIQWSLVIFTALTGTAGWMFASLAFAQVKGIHEKSAFKEGLVALIIMAVGGCASITHLSHPDRVLGALSHPTSGIFTEAALVGISGVFALIMLILMARKSSKTAIKVTAVCAAIFGVLLSIMAGTSYMMPARETWNTILMPLGYLGTVMPAGVALYLAVAKTCGEEELDLFPKLLIGAGVIGAILAAVYVAVSAGADAILLGWCLAVIVGGIAPAVFGALIQKNPKNAKTLAWVAFICAFIGAVAYRVYMWSVASTVDNFFTIW